MHMVMKYIAYIYLNASEFLTNTRRYADLMTPLCSEVRVTLCHWFCKLRPCFEVPSIYCWYQR